MRKARGITYRPGRSCLTAGRRPSFGRVGEAYLDGRLGIWIVAASLAFALAESSAFAQDSHGAIAFGEMDQAVAYSFAWDYPAKDEAEAAALDACLSSGADPCVVLAWFQNSCGALAMDEQGTVAEGKVARTAEQAEARALATCKSVGGVGCAVVGSQCVSGSGEPGTWWGQENAVPMPETTDPPVQPREVIAAAAALDGPKCGELEGTPSWASCWAEVPGQSECYVWTSVYPEWRIEDWSGGCAGNTAHGQGSLFLVSSKYADATGTGTLVDGEQQGHWVIRYTNGLVVEGPYVDGEQQGHWVIRWARGRVDEGPLVDGERHGRWINRMPDGTVQEASYVDGERHGHWVIRWADGSVNEGPYVNDERHGRWVKRWPDGSVYETEWRNGERVD